ncbi:MAG: YIP1 family protein [Lachnospiraceae bacterium]|nr:YIP1 family protein [Lachnospiraceae bacterium]
MYYVKTLTYVFHVIFHPFDGFWDLKKEKRGSLAAAFTFVFLTIATLTIEKQNTGFLFNPNRLQDLNVVVDIVTVLLLYVLWVVANWCLTSLMDGEGTMKDIAMATGYAIFPVILIRLPMVLMSHAITMDEGSFYHVFMAVSYIWAGFLLFCSTMITHQYSIGKTLVTIVLTIVGMAIIMFIGLLFFSVIQQMLGFGTTIYTELRFR